jgi:hypothetical protein
MTDKRSFFTPMLHDTWAVKSICLSRLYVRGRGTIDFLDTVNGIKNTGIAKAVKRRTKYY